MANGDEAAPPGAWRIGEHSAHFDPLLDAVVAVARIFGIATTPQALSAGLPLENNALTPALVPRAASRAGLTAKIARRPLEALRPQSRLTRHHHHHRRPAAARGGQLHADQLRQCNADHLQHCQQPQRVWRNAQLWNQSDGSRKLHIECDFYPHGCGFHVKFGVRYQ